jgi:hypothetical protein
MKVVDLFEAKRVSTDKGYYTPGYDAENKHPVGHVKDWMKRMGVEKDHLDAAMEKAKQLPSYKAISQHDKSTPGEKKNGTFSFHKPGATSARAEKYMVHAHGMIRSSSKNSIMGDERPTRLKSPKPRLVAGDPVKSLVSVYDGAFKELGAKMAKRSEKIKEDSDDVVAKVFAKLDMTHPTEEDKKSMASDALRKTKEGWTVNEIASYMRSMEEVDPDLDEDTALARMKRVRDAVKARLEAEKK